jgi:hypothetical protein
LTIYGKKPISIRVLHGNAMWDAPEAKVVLNWGRPKKPSRYV